MRSVAVLTALLALAVCAPASAKLAASGRTAGDGWRVQVSVEPSTVGPVTVSSGGLRRVRESCEQPWPACPPQPWLQHDIVFENAGDRRVTFTDTRAAAVLGPRGRPMLLASDPDCSYRRVRPIRAACLLLYFGFPTVRPHRSVTRTIALWKGLPGMRPLRPGTYVFRKPMRFSIGRGVTEPGTGRLVTIRIVYRVEPA